MSKLGTNRENNNIEQKYANELYQINENENNNKDNKNKELVASSFNIFSSNIGINDINNNFNNNDSKFKTINGNFSLFNGGNLQNPNSQNKQNNFNNIDNEIKKPELDIGKKSNEKEINNNQKINDNNDLKKTKLLEKYPMNKNIYNNLGKEENLNPLLNNKKKLISL